MSADHFQPDSVHAIRYELQRVHRKFRILLWLLVGVIAVPFVIGCWAAILLPAIERDRPE